VKEIFTTPNILKIENRKPMNTKFAAEDLQVTSRAWRSGGVLFRPPRQTEAKFIN
jgi:hypothetical protein